MKLLVGGDLHLSDFPETPQEQVFLWALSKVEETKCDGFVYVGDVTACGSTDAIMRYRRETEKLSCPVLNVPGNSDLRNEYTAPVLERFLMNYQKGLNIGEYSLVGFDTARGFISETEQKRLLGLKLQKNVLFFSHQGPGRMTKESEDFLISWFSNLQAFGHEILCWAFGHIHYYEENQFAGVPTVCMRALDPDKCIGGKPQLLVIQVEGNQVSYGEEIFDLGLPCHWTEEEKNDFMDHLGITLYHPEIDIPFAIEHQVKNLEIRNNRPAKIEDIQKWRQAVPDSTLSLHLPHLNGLEFREQFHQGVQYALDLKVDMITVHPPAVATPDMFQDGELFEQLADVMAQELKPLADAGVDLLFENSHTSFETQKDPYGRKYGCSPVELMGWKFAIEERLQRKGYGYRLDIGHARNNVPLSEDYPLGRWYGLIGPEAHGYHLHQTIKKDGKFANHYPITGFDNDFVAFDGFLCMWNLQKINHGIMILEIREGNDGGAPATYLRIRELLNEK